MHRSADGNRLTYTHHDNTLRTYDRERGAELSRVTGLPKDRMVWQISDSPDGETVAVVSGDCHVQWWDAATGEPLTAFRVLPGDGYLHITPEGHCRASPEVEKELAVVVQTPTGQETLTPDEFAQRFGWKNDPAQAVLAGNKN